MDDTRFRKDLYARLAGFIHRLAPLRERLDDLGLLLAALLSRAPDERPLQLRPEVVQAFLDHTWPLNVRELEQALTAALALSPDGVIRLEDLPEAIRRGPSSPTATPSAELPPRARTGPSAVEVPPRITMNINSPDRDHSIMVGLMKVVKLPSSAPA